MLKTASRLILGGLLFFIGAVPARAGIGDAYDVFVFKPYLERGYNTRLGWQGWPVSAEDPHLYLYSADNLRLLTELEYLFANGRIHTQTFKLYLPKGQLGPAEWAELEYFALEASQNRISPLELHTLVQHACTGEWLMHGLHVSLIVETSATWLRISSQGGAAAAAWETCRKKLVIPK